MSDNYTEKAQNLIGKLFITDDTDRIDKFYGITPKISDLINAFIPNVEKGKRSIFRELEYAVKLYPDIPQFKNLLVTYYGTTGQHLKASKLNEQIVKEHPDYIFGRIAKVSYLMAKDELEQVRKYIGDEPDISKAFPERDFFHPTEVAKYFSIWMEYAIAIDDSNTVNLVKAVLDNVEVPEEIMEAVSMHYFIYTMTKAQERFEQEDEMKIHVEDLSYDTARQTDDEPDFNHPEIKSLYGKYIDTITEEELTAIMNLPKETLLEDVKTMLADVINRYEYFQFVDVEEYLNEVDFSIHALFLSAALEDESLIPYLLDILRQGDELCRFWFADITEDLFCTAISRCGKNSLDELFSFIKEPNVYYFNKYITAMSVVLMGMDDPGFEPQAKQWLLDVLDFFIEEVENPEIADADTYTLIANTGLYFKESECFVEPVGKLFDLNMIFPGFAGDKSEVLRDLRKTNTRDEFGLNYEGDILEMYREAKMRWAKFSSISDKPFFDPVDGIPVGKPVSKERDLYKDVGRNDPCPCGSGKKFKKCCLN
jgi:hypothetical protein